ncbi:hypothetical protein SEUCBS139899_010829 [Sporothrix eucalyptigena]
MASNNANAEATDPVEANSPSSGNLPDTNSNSQEDGGQADSAPKKPSRLGAIKAKLGINRDVLKTQLRGSLPPILSLVMCQSTVAADYFQPLSFLISISAILGFAIMPRGKFLKNLVLNIIFVCLSASMAMLTLYSAIKARQHTTPAGESPIDPLTGSVRYNSSQSAVCGVWLFANIWAVNFLRAKLPAFGVPVIMYSILFNVSSTFGTRFATVADAESFIKKILSAMLTGLAFATGANLLVFPSSSRIVVRKEFASSIGLLREAIRLQRKYFIGLQELDMFAVVTHQVSMEAEEEEKKNKKTKKPKDGSTAPGKEPTFTGEAAIAKDLKAAINQCREMSGKIQADITFAKRDYAWGKLDAKDLSELSKLLRNATIPVVGITSIMDIFQRVAERHGWKADTEQTPERIAQRAQEKKVWNEVMKRMNGPFGILSEAIDQGLEHAALLLEIVPRPKPGKKGAADADVEARGDSLNPGDVGFSEIIEKKVEQFTATKGAALQAWVKERALVRGEELLSSSEARERDQAQLYVLLYMERLMHASGQAMRDLVMLADRKVQDGTMSKKRLIFPTQRRLRKWMYSLVHQEDSSGDQSADALYTGVNFVYLGDGYNLKKDPEHLPPENTWQRFGNALRKTAAFLASKESAHGLRVACATMTVGILAFLETTQEFFIAQRLVWAMIMVTLGMVNIWYIVDEKTPGTIVFLWVSIFCCYYFMVKFPRFSPIVMVTMITQVLIIGYELQSRKIGIQAAAANRTLLRRDISGALYLLANYFSVITSTVKAQIEGTAGNPDVPNTPAHELQRVRRKIFGKMMLLLPSMATHADWQKFEPSIGGRFPRAAYDDIIKRTSRIMAYVTFMSYTMNHPPKEHIDALRVPWAREPQPVFTTTDIIADDAADQQTPDIEGSRDWLNALAKVLHEISPSHNNIVGTLMLLSNSLYNGLSLPPYLPLPQPYEMTRALLRLDRRYEIQHNTCNTAADKTSSNTQQPKEEDDDEDDEEADLSPLRIVESRTGRTVNEPRPRMWQRQRQHSKQPQQQYRAGQGLGLGPGLGKEHILDPKNVEQPGYAEFAVLEICSTLVCNDLEGLIKTISGLVGVVDFSYRVDWLGSSNGTGSDRTVGGKGKRD